MLLGMTDSINDLPDDIEQLKAMLLAERSEKAWLASHNERLLHMLRQLRRNHFGRKSERLSEDQLNLGLEDLETAIASGEAGVEKADATLPGRARGNDVSIAATCPRICRARRSSSNRKPRAAPAAVGICTSSVRIARSGSTRSQRSTE